MMIGIVADDLTGAADSAAPFANRGYHAEAAFTIGGKLPTENGDTDVRAWSLETREMPPDRPIPIKRLTRAATRRLQAFSPRIYYKKIDSTLRGHLRLELEAMRIELPERIALVCPAFPANGRTVRKGVLQVNGEPRQNVRAAFGMQDDPKAAEVSLHSLRTEAPAQMLSRLASADIHTVFCDAETNEDLGLLARVVWHAPEAFLPVGSAGFSSALAAQLPENPDPAASDFASLTRIFHTGRILVVVGSRNPVSRRQAAYLADKARIQPILFGDKGRSAELQQTIREQFDGIQRIVLLQSPDTYQEDVLFSGLEGAVRSIGVGQPQGLILTGGDSARKLIMHWCTGVRIAGEIRPGIVAGTLIGYGIFGQSLDLVVILKAGGFGAEDTLAECLGLV